MGEGEGGSAIGIPEKHTSGDYHNSLHKWLKKHWFCFGPVSVVDPILTGSVGLDSESRLGF